MGVNIACARCGKDHGDRPCRAGLRVCYICGLPDHYAKDYPQKKEKGPTLRPQLKGRVFALNDKDLTQDPSLIQGKCLIRDHSLIVLYDSGATHSFISELCVGMLDLPISELPYELLVSTPTGDKVLTSTICLNCPIIFYHYTSTVDLICMPMTGIDVILGMNWLSANHILLDCHNKAIRFPLDRPTPTALTEAANFLVHQVEKCVDNETGRCVLLYSLETTCTTDIGEIPVAREFPEVFPPEIESLPPEREVNFSIDLLPGTGPVSIAPYRMSPLELKELKEQLEDLLARNFIRPSASP